MWSLYKLTVVCFCSNQIKHYWYCYTELKPGFILIMKKVWKVKKRIEELKVRHCRRISCLLIFRQAFSWKQIHFLIFKIRCLITELIQYFTIELWQVVNWWATFSKSFFSHNCWNYIFNLAAPTDVKLSSLIIFWSLFLEPKKKTWQNLNCDRFFPLVHNYVIQKLYKISNIPLNKIKPEI